MVKELVPQMGSRYTIFKKIEELKSTSRNLYNGQNTFSDQDPDQVLPHLYNSFNFQNIIIIVIIYLLKINIFFK